MNQQCTTVSRKQKVIYYLQQPHRLGQLLQEVWELRNMFADGDYEFVVITPPVDGRVNKACYDFVMRGLTVIQKRPGELQWSNTAGIQIIDGDIYVLRGAFDFEFDVFKKFLKTKPPFYFSLTDQDIERSNRLRSLFNIPHDAVIVTVHNREPGYLPDPEYHAYRDANIDNYVPAIEYLLGKGYYVIRLGDKTMKPLPPISDRLIDSPFHPMYSQFIELYFVSQSKFMLCAPSGPYGISWTFDVPTLLVNRPVHAGCYMNDHNLMVPKKYYSHILKRHLTYTEIITSPLPDFYQTKLFEEFGVELHENTPDEILRAVQEMDQRLDRQYPLDGPAQTLHRRIKQVQFRGECYRQHACPRFPHYSLYWSKAQLSHEFVKLNPYFLEDGLWLPQESPPQADNAQPQDTCDSASLTYSN